MAEKLQYNIQSMIEHLKMAEMRKKHPEWIWNRSDTHVMLGVPTSHEGYKTVVEPGNSFSPGHRTYGVSTWIYTDGMLLTPEEKPLEQLAWSFLEGYVPVLQSSWQAGGVRVSSQLFSDGDPETNDIKSYFMVEIENTASVAAVCSFYLVIRSFGASGGPINSLELIDKSLYLNDGAVMLAEKAPTRFGAVSYGETGKDIGEFLKLGLFPDRSQVIDPSTWASGAFEYVLTLEPGQKQTLSFICQIHADNWMLKKMLKPLENSPKINEVTNDYAARWKEQRKIKLQVPDQRFQDAFQAQLSHLYMFTVDVEPRITPISYPLWWLRDGAYVLIALDKGGYTDFVEKANRAAAHRDSFGGFGAEGDGPANGIWIITEHYLLTRSKSFLTDMYPHIKRKAELIRQMRHTDIPIKRHNEFRTPEMALKAESDMMCLASEEGLITGRMDHHHPILWINGYSYLALKRAAMCAKELGIEGTWYEEEAEDLKRSIQRKAEKIFGMDPRDINSVFWPTGWGEKDDPIIMQGMDKFWNEERFPNGKHAPEPYWTYFELGQAHNYLLMGQRERAWVSIEYFLSTHTAPGLYTYHEGNEDENSSLQWQRTRGWDLIRYITPHGWTASEMFLLLRDCLAREEGDTLIIGSGVPESWMNEAFSVKDLPTYFGILSFEYDPAKNTLFVLVEHMPKGGIKSGLPISVNVVIN